MMAELPIKDSEWYRNRGCRRRGATGKRRRRVRTRSRNRRLAGI
jgi:hypothetical protein